MEARNDNIPERATATALNENFPAELSSNGRSTDGNTPTENGQDHVPANMIDMIDIVEQFHGQDVRLVGTLNQNTSENTSIEHTEDIIGPLNREDILGGKKGPFLGASYVYDTIMLTDKLVMNRNHPAIVNHIPEILLIWIANIEAKVVQTYPQLINYVMKYTLKPEKKSDTLKSIESKLLEQAKDDQVVRKFCQRILMETVTQRDISVNEAFLILNKDVMNARKQLLLSLLINDSVNLLGSHRLQAQLFLRSIVWHVDHYSLLLAPLVQ